MSARTCRLAVLGADPRFETPLHVGRPNVPDHDAFADRMRGVFERRWLTNSGPLAEELERTLERHLGVRNVVLTSNGTSALEALASVSPVRGEVILPSFTFVATAHALVRSGWTPVFCDVADGSHNIDPGAVERAVTDRTAAIVGVHVWGEPCDVDRLSAIARDAGVDLYFDAAHAFDATIGDRWIGSFGRAEVFSFHATKFLNAFEGGAVATDDDDLADRVRSWRNFGYLADGSVGGLGTNAKMSEASAAMALVNLEHLDELVETNRAHHDRYASRLSGVPGLTMFRYSAGGRRNFQYVVVEVDGSRTGIGRDDLVAALHADGVLARRYFDPGCHRAEPYRSDPGIAASSLPRTDRLCDRVVALPTGTALTADDVDAVSELVVGIVSRAGAVVGALRGATSLTG